MACRVELRAKFSSSMAWTKLIDSNDEGSRRGSLHSGKHKIGFVYALSAEIDGSVHTDSPFPFSPIIAGINSTDIYKVLSAMK